MFAAKRERLTWRATGDQFHFSTDPAIIEIPYISLHQWPIGKRGQAPFLIFPNRVAAVAVSLDDGDRLETGLAYADPKSPRPCKQLNRLHMLAQETPLSFP